MTFYTVLLTMFMFYLGNIWSRDRISFEDKPDTAKNLLVLIPFVVCLSLFVVNVSVKREAYSSEVQERYVIFLDISVIKNDLACVDLRALETLNSFIEQTKSDIVVISNDRLNIYTKTNWSIKNLKYICKLDGIKGNIIGSTPYTEGVYTKQQEIYLWNCTTNIKYNNCVVFNKTLQNVSTNRHTVNVPALLNSDHLLVADKILSAVCDPNMFGIITQGYEDWFKEKYSAVKQIS